MARDTNIQWCDSSVNPVMGCDGCELWTKGRRVCYAGVLHERYAGSNPGYAKDFDEPQKFPGRMESAMKWSDLTGTVRPGKPWLNGCPRLIFVSDMGDALSGSIDFEYLHDEIIVNALSEQGKRHRLLWLTKQPRRMLAFNAYLRDRGVPWPGNLCAMTSITGRGTTGRAWDLRQIGDEHTVRGLSFEPLDSEPDWDRIFRHHDGMKPVHWAIFGGESGPNAPATNMGMFKRGVAAARRHGVAPFVKQLGRRPLIEVTLNQVPVEYPVKDSHGGEWEEWPADMRAREVPAVWRGGE